MDLTKGKIIWAGIFAVLISTNIQPVLAQTSSAPNQPYRGLGNMVATAFTYDRYGDDFEDWQRMYLEYRKFTEKNTYIGRLNVGNRFRLTDYQGEIDLWPIFSGKWYGNFNLGLSGGDLFPEFKGSGELYRVIPGGFEASAGVRYLKFSTDDVFIFTGSLNKYAGSWLLIARPFITPQDSGVSASLNVTARRYFGNPEKFASVIAGFGFSPDERSLIDGVPEERLLKTRYVGLIGNYLVQNRFELFGEVKASSQEFPFTDQFVSIYTFETGIRYRF
ncbi:YaiO family outer membrane beta-barrel protein [Rhodohalobacter mucosus]|uniref:YaiO beta-barrel domain-containing protein n=1 Tax=Rhodohalobacter mucosus TaxID=2079485 RepID=A0A316TSC0_9BACT|nr:YaiO family outer membrane beta-barrel protein [Rhodohalobacter mucosus]PWN05915.1 hypothetical protein DDZ15_12070 [Rhodohalobacter mucosus]